MYIPSLLGFLALIILITLLILDRKKNFNFRMLKIISRFGLSRDSSERFLSTLKGFLLILLLVLIVGAILYYF